MIKTLFIYFFLCIGLFANAQLLSEDELDTIVIYTDLNNALKNPDNVYGLDLSKQKLTNFPKEILLFKNLNYLNLEKNKIEIIPDSIFMLPYLQHLNLSKNNLTDLNSNVFQLSNLKYLNVSSNQIPVLSYKISGLANLKELLLWGLPIIFLPEEIFDLPDLVLLDVRQIYFTKQQKDDLYEKLDYVKVLTSSMCNCGD